jgi:nicotinic acid phosphoribosyltransferase
MNSNPFTIADFYTASSFDFESTNAKLRSVYNMTFRRSPADTMSVAKDSRIVVNGIKMFTNMYLNRKYTLEHLANAQAFMNRSNSFGGPLNFPYDEWYRFITKFDGYLPNVLNIFSVQDGQVVFPNMPIVHVQNSVPGFGHLAAHVETRLLGMVSISSTAATLCRHWLDRVKEHVILDFETAGIAYDDKDVMKVAKWFIHNFGSRACFTDDESIGIGMSHLLSFNGTDNTDAAYQAWLEGAEDGVGTSILALAHRNVQTHNSELECFRSIINATKNHKFRIASLVADCYNYSNAVDTILEEAKANPDVTYVIRPDSGDVFTCLHMIFDKCCKAGLIKTINGFAVPKNVRWIEGDSVNPDIINNVMNRLRTEYKCLPTFWGIFGVGGYIRNSCTRDTLSAKYAVCQVGSGPTERNVVKLSEGGKMSIPGFNYIDETMHVKEYYGSNVLNMNNYHTICNFSFAKAKQTLEKEWDRVFDVVGKNPKFGLDSSHISAKIRRCQDAAVKLHRS